MSATWSLNAGQLITGAGSLYIDIVVTVVGSATDALPVLQRSMTTGTAPAVACGFKVQRI